MQTTEQRTTTPRDRRGDRRSSRWLSRRIAQVILGVCLFGASTILLEAPAHAANCDEQENADSGNKKNYRTVIGPDGRKVFVIEKAFVVCGKVPKPTVIYALQASTINYEWETLKQDFLPKILEATRKAPF